MWLNIDQLQETRECKMTLESTSGGQMGHVLWDNTSSLHSLRCCCHSDASHSFRRTSFPCQLQTVCSESLCSSPALIALSSREFFQGLLQREVSVPRYRAFCAKYGLHREPETNVAFGNLTLPWDSRQREIEKKQTTP